ncbi:MAG: LVIVD repeat-containing protein, partial [Actinomycetota bacterium]
PKLEATYKPSHNPHEFYLWDYPKKTGRALLCMSTPGGETQLLVTDITGARRGKFVELDKTLFPGMEGSLHSLTVSADGSRGYVSHLTGGYMTIDTSEFAEEKRKPAVRVLTPPENAPSWPGPGAHSSTPIFGTDYVLVTDEVYGDALKALGGHGCPWGWTRIIDNGDPRKPKVVADYRIEQNHQDYCTTDPPRPSSSYSAHNPTLTKNLAFISWHAGGLQAIDVSNPRKPVQMAQFVPEPLPYVLQEDPALSAGQDKVVVWSFPIIKDGLVYVVDLRNGLYILDYKGPFDREVKRVDFLEGNSNLEDGRRFGS